MPCRTWSSAGSRDSRHGPVASVPTATRQHGLAHMAGAEQVIDPESAPYNLREDKKRHQKQTYLVKFFGTADL